jgi:HSP20 family molecular chaperone IbpA
MVKEFSFFEKLKKGMGIEGLAEEETEEEKKPRIKKVKKPKELKIKTKPIEPQVKVKDYNPPATLPLKRAPVEDSQPVAEKEYIPSPKKKEEKKKWFELEGQLVIDVYQTRNELIVQSAIAGVKPENLDISIEGDVMSIRGSREKPFEDATTPGNYFVQECYWGPFSREVILPVEVDPGRVEATMKEGILTIRVPKILREKRRKISVKG